MYSMSEPSRTDWSYGRWRPAVTLLCGLLLAGCGRPKPEAPSPPALPPVEAAAPVTLNAGEAFHFADHYHGGEAPAELSRGADGRFRLKLGDARQPVLCVPAPYTIRQKVRLAKAGKLRLAFGMSPESWNKLGAGVRFCVRVRRTDEVADLLCREVKRWRGADAPHWSPVTLEIPACPDEEVEVELATEVIGTPREGPPEDFVTAYALWVNPTLVVPTDEPRPNIVVVFIDALRPDRLGCYGYPRDTSPFIDKIASEGIVFEDATSQATWTLPSTHSLLTSSYRFLNGSTIARSAASGVSEAEQLMLQPVAMPSSLQGELGKAGYATLACVGGGFLNPAMGFDWYWWPEHTPMLADQLGAVKRELSEGPHAPFFLFLHTYEVHNYFQGWAHCLDHFDRGYLGPLTDVRRLMEATLHGSPDALSSADLQYIWDLYDGEIRHTDRYLRAFLTWLLSEPWGKNTVVVIIADHGEALGGHGAMSHGGVPYREVAHVPLLVRLPDGRWGGRRIGEPVALVDLMPTLLEVAGAEPPSGMVGRSLVPLLAGAESGEAPPILCESLGAGLLVYADDWSYLTYRGGRDEALYDLARDPAQMTNLAEAAPEQLRRMRRALSELAMRAARGYRVVVAGPRPDEVTIELECDGPLSYLDVPTLQHRSDLQVGEARDVPNANGDTGAARAGHRVTLRVRGGDDPQVLLFEPLDPKASCTLSARAGGKPVEAERFHLGADAERPERSPITIGPAMRTLLAAEEPPVAADEDTWGVWLWMPAHAAQMQASQRASAAELPQALLDQLQTLGYLR